eukprot:409162_1
MNHCKRKRDHNTNNHHNNSCIPSKKQRIINDMDNDGSDTISQCELKPDPIPLELYPHNLRLNRFNHLLNEMDKQEKYYYQGYNKTDLYQLPIFEFPLMVRSNIISFLNLKLMTIHQFIYHISDGTINEFEYGQFRDTALNAKVYYLSYHWLERLRLAQGLCKTEPRIFNDKSFPNGISIKYKTSHCLRCGVFGHWLFECKMRPRSRIYGNKCFKCGKEGHWSRDCNEPKKKCYVCDSNKHNTEECPDMKFAVNMDIDIDFNKENSDNNNGNKNGTKRTDICYNCGKKGHWARECKGYVEFKRNDVCYNCGKMGHWRKECERF